MIRNIAPNGAQGPLRGGTAVALLLAAALVLLASAPAAGHNLSYAAVRVSFPDAGRVEVEIRCHVPALIMGAPQGHLSDDLTLVFVGLGDAELARRESIAAAAFLRNFSLRADGALIDAIDLRFPSPATLRTDAATPRSDPGPSAPVVLRASLPPGARVVDVALPPDLGRAMVVAMASDGRIVSQAVSEGERTQPLRIAGPSGWRDALDTLWRFVVLGFQHILPLGYDHVLFIVALAIGTPRLGTLVKLATLFTLAHSVTLALASFGLVRAPPALVEPAIAASIVLMALANLMTAAPTGPQAARAAPVRAAVIFAFGLLHGLGFAGALRAAGLQRGHETSALAGFNIGVEFGQVAVILVVLALVGWFPNRAHYRALVVLPASVVIGALALFWTLNRILEAFGGPSPGSL